MPGAGERVTRGPELIGQADDHCAVPAFLSCNVKALLQPRSVISQALNLITRGTD